MSIELMYGVLLGGGLLVGWLLRHYGVLAPAAPTASDGRGLTLLAEVQEFLRTQQQHLQTTDVLKQLVEKLPKA